MRTIPFDMHASAFGEVVLEQLATKQDLLLLKQELSADIQELRAELRESEARTEARLKDLELRLTLRLGGMLAAAVAIIAALIKLL